MRGRTLLSTLPPENDCSGRWSLTKACGDVSCGLLADRQSRDRHLIERCQGAVYHTQSSRLIGRHHHRRE